MIHTLLKDSYINIFHKFPNSTQNMEQLILELKIDFYFMKKHFFKLSLQKVNECSYQGY